jgi:hypothetical protein
VSEGTRKLVEVLIKLTTKSEVEQRRWKMVNGLVELPTKSKIQE